MGFLSGLFRTRDAPQNRTVGSNYAFYLGGSTSGKMVNERSAMQMTAVYACVRILAEAIAGLPLHLYKYTDEGGKEKAMDNGLVPQYYVEGNHEAIIPREIFLRVQEEELVRRRVVNTSANGKKRSYSCNHCFSQIIICGDCGEMFRRIHWNNHGCKSVVWRCISRLEPTGLECHTRTVNEQELEAAVVKALNELLAHREGYQNQLAKNIATVIRASATASTDAIDEKLLELQQDLLKKANNKEAYDEIADEIFRLRELKQQTAVDNVTRDEQISRITELQDFIRSQSAELTEFDEVIVKRWVQKITVWPDRVPSRFMRKIVCRLRLSEVSRQ